MLHGGVFTLHRQTASPSILQRLALNLAVHTAVDDYVSQARSNPHLVGLQLLNLLELIFSLKGGG
jgi:N-methylhydantoinase B/oxoprolinase/acetone carboxylase alpha subunit